MADLYLSSGDNLTGVTFGGNVFGAAGTETVTYTNDATGIVVDQNVEQVRLTGATSSYTFQQAGNQLLVFSGSTQVARITLQNDTNGTLISFANGTVEARVSAAGLTLGGTTVPATAPTPIIPTTIDSSGGTAVQTLTLTQGPDTLTGTNGDDVFNALPVNAAGVAVDTLSAFDDLDGGTGTDTLNIYTTGTENNAFPANTTVENVEIVNIFNAAAAADLADASNYAGVQQLWQIGAAADVTNLAEGTVAGFRNLEAAAGDIDVTAAATATSVAIEADGLAGATAANVAHLDVAGEALNSVTVQGTLEQNTANATAASLALDVTVGEDEQTLTVNSAVATTLTVDDSGSTDKVTSVNAAASAGAISFIGDTDVASIATGAGDDVVTLDTTTAANDPATSIDETVSASVVSGAGADEITVTTDGAGTTAVDAGDGDDTVVVNSRSDGKLTVNLGAGVDTFNVGGLATVNAGDTIDAGAGLDTLRLNIVGAANIGAFSNFEVFDAAGLGKALDVNILASNNTVTEFVTTGDVGANAELLNVGANVGYRVTGDTVVGNDLEFNQATPGALTVTLDIDEPSSTAPASTTAATAADASVTTNATSVNAVFDSAFVDAATGAGDNATQLVISADDAASLSVVSGGANASNELVFNGTGDLTSVTVSGAQALDLDLAGATNVASVNASALTGNLAFDLADLAASGSITLGSGDDVLVGANDRSIVGFEKGTAEDATAQSDFDVISLAGSVQAGDFAVAGGQFENGLLTFTGAGPATLTEALGIANLAANGANEALVFEYLGDSYVFSQGGATDTVIELSGVTGLTGLDTVGASANVYVF
ncbi:hypothetical protein [Sphingobium sp. DC-2]|uniref:beta strand repeat-containing protein n=1 Tax=Sphingobium sp. DC-2 TaxID=1303256 RepID=UPI0004C3BC7B|nr:hypothetical protein [Sphingobium sp. DC-2]